MSYNKDTDYQSKINEAVEKGDYESAAQYEQSRNEKIDAENLDYEKTNRYSGWLDRTDYSQLLKKQMSSGASGKTVAGTLKKRVAKASGTDGLSQYTADDVYDQAIKYIMGANAFSYDEKRPEYKNSYKSEIDSLYKKLTGIKDFSYDPYDDDLYEYYRKQYIREGNRAMEDILGELSAMTGGVASSYAVSAAAQGRNYYNQKMTDMIPKLYEDAYERYIDSIERQEKNIDILSSLADSEHKRYLDSMDLYNRDREFDYKAFLERLDYDRILRDDEKWQTEFDNENSQWQTELDKKYGYLDKEYDYLYDKMDFEKSENEKDRQQTENENKSNVTQQQIENALKKWDMLGYLDEESAAILGLPKGTHSSDYDYKTAQKWRIYNR